MVFLNLSLSDYYDIILTKYEQSILEDYSSDENVALINSLKRVISCFVNELLVSSKLLKITKNVNKSEESYWIVMHSNNHSEYNIWVPIIINLTEKNINFDIKNGTVKFLDPNDIGQVILITEIRNKSIHCELVTCIKQIFATLLVDRENECKVSQVINEINNSIQHQILAYKENNSFIPLGRPPMEYEQSIIEGHHSHPMNKSRVPMHQMIVNTSVYNFNAIKVHFYKVPKSVMNIYGNYEKVIEVVAKEFNISYNNDTEIIVPVHELQKDVIRDYFTDLSLQDITSTSAFAQCSLRTVNINNISDYSFKLSFGMVITSAMRTITHWSTYHGVLIEPVLERIIGNKKTLTFLSELGSIIVKNDDKNISKHFACIIRDNVSVKLSDPSETAIVCAYLTEKCNNEYNITKLFDLKTQDDKNRFSDLYAKLLIDSIFDIVYEYGFSFEAHQQNLLLRVKKNTDYGYELAGLIVRDFGGIKVHQETLNSKIGMTVSVLDNKASILADKLESVYKVCYHTLFHCHLQQIFRSLGTHDNGKGWLFVRQHLKTKTEFLANERCRNFFFSNLAPFKCFLKMKLNDYERDYLYTDVPNVINFIGI